MHGIVRTKFEETKSELSYIYMNQFNKRLMFSVSEAVSGYDVEEHTKILKILYYSSYWLKK